MVRIRLRCYDPNSPWPPGLVKDYDEGVARELLRISPYYVEVFGEYCGHEYRLHPDQLRGLLARN